MVLQSPLVLNDLDPFEESSQVLARCFLDCPSARVCLMLFSWKWRLGEKDPSGKYHFHYIISKLCHQHTAKVNLDHLAKVNLDHLAATQSAFSAVKICSLGPFVTVLGECHSIQPHLWGESGFPLDDRASTRTTGNSLWKICLFSAIF